MTRLAIPALVAALLASPSLALAQPAPPPVPPPPPQQQPQPQTGVDQGVIDDANSGRVWFAPSAQTAPAGSWSVHNHELVIIGAGYAPSDQLQLSLSTLFPVTTDVPLILLGTIKYQFLKQGRLRAAAHANLNYFGDDVDSATTALVGGVASYCLDDKCHSLLNGYLAAGFLLDEDQGGNVPFIGSVGAVIKVGRRVRLLAEVNSGFIAGDYNEVADGALVGYGVRFTSKNIGVDFGAIKPICEGCSDDELFPLGFPWISVTYRDGPSL